MNESLGFVEVVEEEKTGSNKCKDDGEVVSDQVVGDRHGLRCVREGTRMAPEGRGVRRVGEVRRRREASVYRSSLDDRRKEGPRGANTYEARLARALCRTLSAPLHARSFLVVLR